MRKKKYRIGERVAALQTHESPCGLCLEWREDFKAWLVPVTADLDDDGSYAVIVFGSRRKPPPDLFVIEKANNYEDTNRWRLVDE